MPEIVIGQLKSEIVKHINDDYIEFGFWLYIPKQKILLSFHRQICQMIASI